MKLIAKYRDEVIPVEVERVGSGYLVKMRGQEAIVDLTTANQYMKSLRLEDGTQFLLRLDRDGATHEISFADQTVHVEIHDPLAMKRRRLEDEGGGAGRVVALMPGRVVKVTVSPGDEVVRGAPLLILEAMKMQNEIVSPRDGKVVTVFVQDGQTVDGGADLVLIE